MKKSIYFLASVLMAGTHFTDRAIAQVTNENFAIGGRGVRDDERSLGK